MAKKPIHQKLSRRERQIMDIIYREGRCTAQQVMEMMDDAPGYSTVRTLLGVLERKGHLQHERKSYHYEYFPTTPASEVRTTALQHLMDTFFQGSPTRVVSALIDLKADKLTEEEYEELTKLIEKAQADES
ncbi:MAG TPA: BlaI/MecI/CopY family transcriptional regulator [Acidobacteriota bacterium]|nr:BlaI/MecI/CopY family transcriptional regulator [Acidobacteriota bacterium]